MELFTTQAALKPMTTPVGIAICVLVFVICGGVAVVEQLLNKRGRSAMICDNEEENGVKCVCDCCVKSDVCGQTAAVRKFQEQFLCTDVNEFCDDFGVKVKIECTKYLSEKKVNNNGF